jgi:hypothetical protein
MESFSDNRISINTYSDLLKHGIDIGVVFTFTAFRRQKKNTASTFNILKNILQFLTSKRHPGTSKEKHVCLSKAFHRQFRFVYFTLEK